jgi:hypothetical protein
LNPTPNRLAQSAVKALFIAFLFFTGSMALAADDEAADDRLAQYRYLPSDDPQADVQRALAQAKAENKLAMIVLGAEWCHDSVGFGSKLSQPTMQAILKSSYVSVFVDVGYLEDMRVITQPLGYPINFGTPTVLVIDPESGQLLNYDSVSTWQSAFSVPLEDYEQAFTELAQQAGQTSSTAAVDFTASPALREFQDAQVERLLQGYRELGPLLAAYDTKDLESPDEFETLWVEVRDFRAQLQKDLLALRQQEMSPEPAAESLPLPDYPAFSWE